MIQTGIASIYDYPQAVACPHRGRFNPRALTAAHKTLPCGTVVKVTNHANQKVVFVVINDRGPFRAGRVIDLTPAAARAIGLTPTQGLAKVTLEVMP